MNIQDEKYLYKDSIMLDGCKVDVGGGPSALSGSLAGASSIDGIFGASTGVGTLGSSRKGMSNHSFLLVTEGNKKAYTIITKNENERDRWLEAVTCAIESVNPAENAESAHFFTLTTFTQADARCSHCQKLMKGVIYQGYSCEVCRSNCHRQCLREYCSSFTCEPYTSNNNNINVRGGPFRASSGTISPPINTVSAIIDILFLKLISLFLNVDNELRSTFLRIILLRKLDCSLLSTFKYIEKIEFQK